MAIFVGIQASAFARARLVDIRLKWKTGTTLGKLAMIWGESQELGLLEGVLDEVLVWADMTADPEAAQFVAAISEPSVRFLVPKGGGRFLINGNEEELAKIQRFKERSRKGGLAKNQKKECLKQPASTPSSSPKAASSTPQALLQAGLNPSPISAVDVTRSVSQITSANPQAGRQHTVDNPPEDDSPVPEPGAYGEVVALERNRGKPKYADVDMQLARWFLKQVTAHVKVGFKLEFADLENWANEIRLMQDVDEIHINELHAVLRDAFDDRSAAPYLESPSGARRNWERLKTVHNKRKLGFDKNAGGAHP